ncbi:MAG: hypothetical protein K6A63_08830 [Acholeplasmatales bacterium]|nr:hypothetical protein [Acholeplasmatales bacterium]
MIIELTEKEAKLVKMLLSEEVETINQLIKEVNRNDAKELNGQVKIMKNVIIKL